MKSRRDVNTVTESRTAQIDREIESLVAGFVGKPSKKASDSLYYLARERAKLLRAKKGHPHMHEKNRKRLLVS